MSTDKPDTNPLDELIGKIERLAEFREHLVGDESDGLYEAGHRNACNEIIAIIKTRRPALERGMGKDSERYKWTLISNNFVAQISNGSADNGKWYAGTWELGGPVIKFKTALYDNPDAAIDAAMKEADMQRKEVEVDEDN